MGSNCHSGASFMVRPKYFLSNLKNVKSPNDWRGGVYANVKRRVFTVNKYVKLKTQTQII